MVMTSQERLLTAWAFLEPDGAPIELSISVPARESPEAESQAVLGETPLRVWFPEQV